MCQNLPQVLICIEPYMYHAGVHKAAQCRPVACNAQVHTLSCGRCTATNSANSTLPIIAWRLRAPCCIPCQLSLTSLISATQPDQTPSKKVQTVSYESTPAPDPAEATIQGTQQLQQEQHAVMTFPTAPTAAPQSLPPPCSAAPPASRWLQGVCRAV